MTSAQVVQFVLREYPAECRPAGDRLTGSLQPLASGGGFSGAALWRLTTPRGSLCLRRWPPEHPQPDVLTFMHQVLAHVRHAGYTLLPEILPTSDGRTIISRDGSLWELTTWLPGVADYHAKPTPARLSAALRALAQFHKSAADCPVADPRDPGLPREGISPGLAQRRRMLAELQRGDFDVLRDAVLRDAARVDRTLHQRSVAVLDHFPRHVARVEGLLSETAALTTPLQPCLCDIWHDHVLFTGDEVSGLVDYGAMRRDCIARDIARLLGSLALDDQDAWQTGLAAYNAIRPLSAEEQQLIRAFDAASVLLSPINWLRWLYVEERQFEDPAAVIQRLDHFLDRLG